MRKPKLIIITGCAGSGKTTLGRTIARRLGYAYVDKDTVTQGFTDFVLSRLGSSSDDRESDIYRNNVLPIEYASTLRVCREILEGGVSVVLTIPFISQIREYGKWESLRLAAGIDNNLAGVSFVWIKHDIVKEHRNILKRNAQRDNFKLDNWESYSRSLDGIEPDDRYGAFIFENDVTDFDTLFDSIERL